MTRIYIAGPMTGLPELNYPAFTAAAKAWREAGWTVLNPAENFAVDDKHPYADFIRRDLLDVLVCDALAVLPGWENSKGASLEHHVATVLGLPIYNALTVVAP